MVAETHEITVIGIGNLLMHDDGAGIHAINKLMKDYRFEPQIRLIDGGTMGSELLPIFESTKKVILVDAVNFNKEPGFIGSIENDDILARLTTKLSMHHLGLTDVLSQIKLLGIEPEQIFLAGIQPEDMSEMTMELSDAVEQRLERLIEVVIIKLEEWGVQVSKNTP